jgi:hypothetical protein
MTDQHMNPSDAVKALADCGRARRWRIITARSKLTDEADRTTPGETRMADALKGRRR